MIMKKNRLKEFASAIAVPLHNTDGIKWPIRSGAIISQVGEIYALEFLNQLEELINTVDPECWNKAFTNSLNIWKVSHHLINGFNKAGVKRVEIARYIDEIIDVLEVITHGEPLLRTNHLVLDYTLINQLCYGFQHITSKWQLERIIDLSAILWAYADSIYFQGREICCEYHGPYILKNNNQLIIRDYKNLNTIELWPSWSVSDIPYKIRIATFHDDSLKMTFDAYNNTNVVYGNVKESCIAALVFIDEKISFLNNTDEMANTFLRRIEEHTAYVNHMEPFELYKKYIDIFWYRKRNLANILGYDWKPSIEVYDKLRNINIEQSNNNPHGHLSLDSVAKIYDYSEDL